MRVEIKSLQGRHMVVLVVFIKILHWINQNKLCFLKQLFELQSRSHIYLSFENLFSFLSVYFIRKHRELQHKHKSFSATLFHRQFTRSTLTNALIDKVGKLLIFN